jgi:SAM-dependent methyltransferase
VTGIDVDPHAVAEANERGADRCSFRVLDANERLPLADGSFDVVFSNDSVHHLQDRSAVLRDWARVLRPEGQVLFTEGLVLTGPVSNEEVRRRTFMGFFMVTPPGANQRAIDAAGLVLERAEDRSGPVAEVGGRMRAARDRHRDEVIAAEGAEAFEAFQDFLDVAVSLDAERTLSRWVFHARKASGPLANAPGARHRGRFVGMAASQSEERPLRWRRGRRRSSAGRQAGTRLRSSRTACPRCHLPLGAGPGSRCPLPCLVGVRQPRPGRDSSMGQNRVRRESDKRLMSGRLWASVQGRGYGPRLPGA